MSLSFVLSNWVMCLCVCLCVCVCVSVSVCLPERGREGERERKGKRETDIISVSASIWKVIRLLNQTQVYSDQWSQNIFKKFY